jgi:hypothetical protein
MLVLAVMVHMLKYAPMGQDPRPVTWERCTLWGDAGVPCEETTISSPFVKYLSKSNLIF